MPERYTRIKELTFPEQPAACPVTLDKGALLLDNEQGRCILQLKLFNGGTKPVEAVQVAVDCLDGAGQSIRTVKHTYSTTAAAGAFFGNNQAIGLGSADTKDVHVTVRQKFRLRDLWFFRLGVPFTVVAFLLSLLNSSMPISWELTTKLPARIYSAFVLLCIGTAIYFAFKENGILQKIFRVLLYVIAAYFALNAVNTLFVLFTPQSNNIFFSIISVVASLMKATVYLFLTIPKTRDRVKNAINTNYLPWAIGMAAITALAINF